MKKAIYIVALILFATSGKAQQLAQYSQYMLNNYVLNPAVAGSTPCFDVKIGYRTQWLGFDAQPKTGFVSLYKPFKFKKSSNSKGRHAIGGYFEQDITGPSSRSVLYLSYSYHLPVSRTYSLGAGIFGGVMYYVFNPGSLVTAIAGDAALAAAGSKFVVPDFNPGLWLYSSKHYVGLSVKSIVGNKIPGIKSKLSRTIYLTSGYKISTGTPWAILPSVFLRYSFTAPIGLDVNCMFDYMNMISIGASYRIRDGVAALIKFHYKRFTIGYSYDYTLSKIRIASSNTHEVILGMKICPIDFNSRNAGEKGDEKLDINKCPAYN